MAVRLAIILSSTLLAGCASTTITGELPEPEVCEVWTYPTISTTQLECLTFDTYERLVLRDTQKTLHIDELCAIIENHNDSQER